THAQDHLMTAILLKDMAKEFMDLYQRLEEK
ncbi:MAG: PTS lactose/cellobiose transporter subunit IIA, partial [Halanaerobium sp.]